MTDPPFRLVAANAVNMRGWFVPGFWPMTRTKSDASKQSSRTVPLPMPMAADNPTPLDSWHILLQSGKLFVPICRANVPHRKAASFDARPDV